MKNLTTIILIDDEMVLRHGLKYLCDWEASGFTIIGEAANGIEGFRLVEQLRPDIVITDIVMPGMDGVSLISKIKEHFPNIHIIVLSSYDNFSYAKSAFKLGIDDYLLKPDEDGKEVPNPDTLIVHNAVAEPSIVDSQPGTRYQFFRHGYYIEDTKLSEPGAKVFNQIVGLKSSWKPAK